MSGAVYDKSVKEYVDFVDRALAGQPSFFGEMLDVFRILLAHRLAGARICDVACGEGYLSRYLADLGASEVVGIDLSSGLIDVAQQRTEAPHVSFLVDDAQHLSSQAEDSLDVVVSQMALMDVADHHAMFRAVHRVLKPEGAFAFSLLHPCFEGPYEPPEKPQFLVDEHDTRVACVVHRYATEGHWQAEGAGLRGRVGSYHRTLSTYINDLVATGFRLARLVEPVFDVPGIGAEVPRVLMVLAYAH